MAGPSLYPYWCVLNVGLLDGLGMGWKWDDDITNVMKWIIPENSLRLAPVSIVIYEYTIWLFNIDMENHNFK